jgi:mRNA interferase RelE/StbE
MFDMNIKYSKRAIKTIKHLDAADKKRIKKGIDGMPLGDIIKLKGHTELYRLRVGDWRIVFSYPDDETILIEKIAPRGEVYKGV